MSRCAVCSASFCDREKRLDHEWICRRPPSAQPVTLSPPSSTPRIPPSLAGFRFGSDAVLPMPLPPVPGAPVVHVVHPFPYTNEGWTGTLPGPVVPPAAAATAAAPA